jgi:hypothetical protein
MPAGLRRCKPEFFHKIEAKKETREIFAQRRTPALARLMTRALHRVIVAMSILRGRSTRPLGEIISV